MGTSREGTMPSLASFHDTLAEPAGLAGGVEPGAGVRHAVPPFTGSIQVRYGIRVDGWAAQWAHYAACAGLSL